MSKERELLERWLDDTIFEPEELDSLMEETRELLAQPEPFMFENRELTGSLVIHDDLYKKGYARGVKDSNREPLSDDAICEILLKKEWKGFVDLVRIIEKAHGIGGGE